MGQSAPNASFEITPLNRRGGWKGGIPDLCRRQCVCARSGRSRKSGGRTPDRERHKALRTQKKKKSVKGLRPLTPTLPSLLPHPFFKKERGKDSRCNSPGQTEPEKAVSIDRIVEVAIRRANAPKVVDPGAAANDAGFTVS